MADAFWAEEQSEGDRGAFRQKTEDLLRDIRSAEKEVEACEVNISVMPHRANLRPKMAASDSRVCRHMSTGARDSRAGMGC